MSFSWSIRGKRGADLLKKYDIHYQGLGLAPNTGTDSPAHNRLSDIRRAFIEVPFKNSHAPAAQAAVAAVQDLLRQNMEELTPSHCGTCACPAEKPNWDVEQIKRFLAIPLDEVSRADGGY